MIEQEDLNKENSVFLGDGAYAHIDKMNRLWLLTSNGIYIENRICLEFEVMNAFMRVCEDYKSQIGLS
jgi:hypothetical protein